MYLSKILVPSMAAILSRHLERVIHQVQGHATEKSVLATLATARLSNSYLHSNHNYNTSTRRSMWIFSTKTSCMDNDQVIQCSKKVQSHLDNSLPGIELLTALGTTAESVTVQECCVRLQEVFQSCDVSEPDQSTQYLVAHVLGLKTLHCVDQKSVLSVNQLQELTTLSSWRLTGRPIQYVLGEWDFRNLTLHMAPPVFIPRPETEELISLVLNDPLMINSERFIEIGCGSGAICLSLLHERPKLSGVALESSSAACQLTRQNAVTVGVEHRLELLHRTLEQQTFQEQLFHEEFDLLVSNPPYIKTADMDDLQSEVTDFEDHNALHGGSDGLDVIRFILQGASRILKPTGSVWLEVDSCHPPLIKQIVEVDRSLGLAYVDTHTDFRGLPRFCHLRCTAG